METKKFQPEDFEAFLTFLPETVGRKLRHSVEVRDGQLCRARLRRARPQAQCRRDRGRGNSKFPQIADPTADFVYLRIMGTDEKHRLGYSEAELDAWAKRARDYAAGSAPDDLQSVSDKAAAKMPRDVYLYVISGHKILNPAAAMALIERLQ